MAAIIEGVPHWMLTSAGFWFLLRVFLPSSSIFLLSPHFLFLSFLIVSFWFRGLAAFVVGCGCCHRDDRPQNSERPPDANARAMGNFNPAWRLY
jgi:hypothetical protein